MNELMKQISKASTLEYASVMSKSDIYNKKDVVETPVPGLNIAYSGRIDGGLSSGLHVWAGPSRHFKSLFCLISAAAYMHQHEDSICIFYDNEFGSPKEYFEAAGIDPDRVWHAPFFTLEDLRTDVVNQLKKLRRGQKVVFVVDSLGLAASEKEVKDAEDGSDKADMTRAKVNKSLFRIVTPYLRVLDIPMLVVQHVYVEQKMYGKTIISGGTGTLLAADNAYIVGRQQEKDGTELTGFNFIINIEKSRFTREKAKIPVTVIQGEGIKRWGGLFDIALDLGVILKINNQSYELSDEYKMRVTYDTTFKKSEAEHDNNLWRQLCKNQDFLDLVAGEFATSGGKLIETEE